MKCVIRRDPNARKADQEQVIARELDSIASRTVDTTTFVALQRRDVRFHKTARQTHRHPPGNSLKS